MATESSCNRCTACTNTGSVVTAVTLANSYKSMRYMYPQDPIMSMNIILHLLHHFFICNSSSRTRNFSSIHHLVHLHGPDFHPSCFIFLLLLSLKLLCCNRLLDYCVKHVVPSLLNPLPLLFLGASKSKNCFLPPRPPIFLIMTSCTCAKPREDLLGTFFGESQLFFLSFHSLLCWSNDQ